MGDRTPNNLLLTDVLTLEEAALYLRISKDKMEELAQTQRVPAQKIDSDWRFSKEALSLWLKLGQSGEWARVFPNALTHESPQMFELLLELRQMILNSQKLQEEQPKPKPKKSSKEAIDSVIGSLRDEENPEAFQATLRAIRKEGWK